MGIKWLGNDHCDLCGNKFGHNMYDAKTVYGCWAAMCTDCYVTSGVGLGTGLGQKYKRNENGELIKVVG